MINQVSAVVLAAIMQHTTLFSRRIERMSTVLYEPLTSAEARKEKEHTALFMTLGGIAIATGLFALLGKLHAKGVLSEIKDPDTVSEHFKSWIHKTGQSANSMGKTIKGWFSKKK